VEGVDDDETELTISPALHFEARGPGVRDRLATGAWRGVRDRHATGHGAFTEADEGRQLTILTGAHRRRTVLIDGVQRRVQWGRRVELSGAEREEILGKKGRKVIERSKWKEWAPEEMTDAVIKRVDPAVGGMVTVECGTTQVQIENPENGVARLAVLEELIGPGVFTGKGLGARTAAVHDKMGDALTDARVECRPACTKMLIGHKSEFALRQLAARPHAISLATLRDLRATRHQWRQKGGSGPHSAAAMSEERGDKKTGLAMWRDLVVKGRTGSNKRLVGGPANAQAACAFADLSTESSTPSRGTEAAVKWKSCMASRRTEKTELARVPSDLKSKRATRATREGRKTGFKNTLSRLSGGRNSCADEAKAAGGLIERPGRVTSMNKTSAANESRSCMDCMTRMTRDESRACGSTTRSTSVRSLSRSLSRSSLSRSSLRRPSLSRSPSVEVGLRRESRDSELEA